MRFLSGEALLCGKPMWTAALEAIDQRLRLPPFRKKFFFIFLGFFWGAEKNFFFPRDNGTVEPIRPRRQNKIPGGTLQCPGS